MRIAVLGVGLIGGSIGLAARRRLHAEVVGFDPDQSNLASALKLETIDRTAGSVADAVADAELVFCAAPVRALGDLIAAALDASGADTAVTDVGSTKRELMAAVAGHTAASRYVGGHPLAGAETAGVANARDDLFDGARWYLTPEPGCDGLLYDRVQRVVADLGARPQALDAEAHDRMMAPVSHLPHVIANVLVAQAATALGEDAERLPEVGPSFRDTTRVAGANPAIWTDIFTANGDAVATEIDHVVERLGAAAALIREGNPASIAAWQRQAGESRRALVQSKLGAGALREVRLSVSNKPGTVAEIALALGRAGVNIEDMALYPAQDMRTGAISLWVAGDQAAQQAARVAGDLGHTVTLVGAQS